VHRSTSWYVGATLCTAVLSALIAVRTSFVAVTRADLAVLRAVAHVRVGWLTPTVRAMDHAVWPWVVRVLAFGTIAILLAYRRFRYLAVYGALLFTGLYGSLVLANAVGRMRPAGVQILTRWEGYSYPSRPVLAFALVLAGVAYTVVPAARWRDRTKVGAGIAIAVFACVRLYLAADHPSDIVAAMVLGWTVPVVAFRWLTPEEAFPVTYRHGTRAHLDVGGRRGEAIRTALDQQLGLTVTAIEAFGLAGSAGSTPLRLTRGSGIDATTLFAKLYALNHLRSDRWYKFTRTIAYGRLEDEKPFSTVRRLAEYEDHMLRLMRDAGLPTPAPAGFAEITPEREYIIVMEFFQDARELGPEIDTAVIDDALAVVRRLWDAGIAHRDIKPSNLLVRDGQVLLIDVSFATVRPTPWRQAVDLANMMLTLALSSTPELVYERALRQFAPADIAEAFAASRSVTIPAQLRAGMRADGRDLIGTFRRLAPDRRPIAIQLWSIRRVGVTAGVLALATAAVLLANSYFRSAGLIASETSGSVPTCTDTRRLAVVAQSVATASYIPCVAERRPGWSTEDFDPRAGRTTFSLVTDRDPAHHVVVELLPSCDTTGATPTTPRADGVRTYMRPRSIDPRYAGLLTDVFPGGCISYQFDFARGPHIALIDDFEHEIGLRARRDLRLALDSTYSIHLDP